MPTRRPLLVVSSLLLAACRTETAPPAVDMVDDLLPDDGAAAPAEPPPGLEFLLREGAASHAPAAPRPPAAAAAPLSDPEVRAILARLPALASAPGDVKSFALRPATKPPPRSGVTVEVDFPAPPQAPPPEPASGPLRVLRHGPTGEVPIAADLSLTFSEPMVALRAHRELGALTPPATLSPQPPGEWRWVGTRNLVFHATGRFPMATDYRVEVPAGTSSALGNKLSEGTSFTFSTPPVRLVESAPREGSTTRDPAIFLAFDQRVDPAALLPHIELLPAGGEPVAARLLTRDEALQDRAIGHLVRAAEEGRWAAVRPVSPLPADRDISVILRAGLPSAEGPRTTTQPQTFGFRTFGRLRLESAECGWGGWRERCSVESPFRFTFNNELDARRFKPDQVRVEPELPGLKVQLYENELHVTGAARARQTYTVTIDPSLRDTYRQALGAPAVHSFTVDPPEPRIDGWPYLAFLDPASSTFTVSSIGIRELEVQLHAVAVADWGAYAAFSRSYDEGKPTTPPGRPVFTGTVKVSGDPDQRSATAIDLSPALSGGLGHVVVLVEGPGGLVRERPRLLTWVQATQIGVDLSVDHGQLVAFASALATGAPLADVDLQLLSRDERLSATTGPDGLARIPLPIRPSALLLAHRGPDTALITEELGWYAGEGGGWGRSDTSGRLLWHVFDDRQLYRPGETARVKGWVRHRGYGPRAALRRTDARSLRYVLRDSGGADLLTGEAPLSALGGFDLALPLPKEVNLGYAHLELSLQDGELGAQGLGHSLLIEEFRRPEFEVKARADAGPHFVGGGAALRVAANYFAGGALPGAEVRWVVRPEQAHFRPPGRDDFRFGRWRPWWGDEGGEFEGPYRGSDEERSQHFTGRTDALGEHHLRAEFLRLAPLEATALRAEATVLDVNRQAQTAATALLVHPAAVYVGLRAPRPFVERGEPLVVEALAVDLAGAPAPGRPLAIRAARVDHQQVAGAWEEVLLDPQPCDKPSAAEPVRCEFVAREGGAYRITATVTDDAGRPNASEMNLWVSGEQGAIRGPEQQTLQLVPDKPEYAVGDTARVLVVSPFSPAEGVLTLRREGIYEARRVSLAQRSTTLEIPITAELEPGVGVHVHLAGAEGVPGSTRTRPAHAAARIELKVPPRSRALHLSVTPDKDAIEPGAETSLEVVVRDADARPVAGGEVAVVVVDEAVLALTEYRTADPLRTFFPAPADDVRDHSSRERLVFAPNADDGDAWGGLRAEATSIEAGAAAPKLASPYGGAQAVEESDDEAGGAPGGARRPALLALRRDFDALALFAAALPTDAQGRARVKVRVPDNLTRYRVMAVAAAGVDRFGAAESAITARLPLMVRPSPPRFLNFGDRFELPIVLQNLGDAPLTVSVAARAANLDLLQGAGRKVQVPAGDRALVLLPAAAVRPGTARLQVGAVAGRWSDAAALELPVWTPATTEAFATYGQLDEGAAVQPLRPPASAVPEFGGLEISTSSTALAELTDAVLYLVRYPFECGEPIASRLLSLVALKDVLAAFRAEGLPAPEELEKFVAADIERLARLQNGDGGWGFWRSGEPSWPFLSVHVAHALARARAAGYPVPEPVMTAASRYLGDVERAFPTSYPAAARRPIVAYALYVRERLGDPDPTRARALYGEVPLDEHSLETLGWLLPVLGASDEATAILGHLRGQLRETAEGAHFTTGYSDGAHLLLHSERRVDGVLLEALIGADPGSDVIPKLVRGLLAGRRGGRWQSTQENALILLALDRYFRTYEAATPDFVARAWLGPRAAGEHRFAGRTSEQARVAVPMDELLKIGPSDLALAKEGPGRLYYRLGLRYAPKDLSLAPLDRGFAVERRYDPIDAPSDVRRDPDGTWRVRAGARVAVTVSLAAQDRRYHVALVDPLPAGLEPISPALATTGRLDPGGAPQRGWGAWYEHENLRDDRAEAFTSLLWDGVYTYRYTARATTPGDFVVPPARAEEMYAPETFGRSASDRVRVE